MQKSLNVARGAACVLLALMSAACASAPGSQHPTTIAEADRQAHDALANESAIEVARIPARSLGVLPFAVATRDTLLRPLGYAMAEFMMTDLAQSDQLVIVDRLRLDAVFRELDLLDRGLLDPRGAPRVGRLIGARRLLLGDVSTLPSGDVVFSVRVVDVISGTVAQVLTASAPVSRVIDAEKALALRVFEELGVVLTPTQRVAVEQRQTTNLAATVSYGRGLDAEAHRDMNGALAAFEDAARLDAAFSAARTQVAAAGGNVNPSGASRSSSVKSMSSLQRVLDLTAQAINTPVTTKVPEAVDAPATAAGQGVTIAVTVTVKP